MCGHCRPKVPRNAIQTKISFCVEEELLFGRSLSLIKLVIVTGLKQKDAFFILSLYQTLIIIAWL